MLECFRSFSHFSIPNVCKAEFIYALLLIKMWEKSQETFQSLYYEAKLINSDTTCILPQSLQTFLSYPEKHDISYPPCQRCFWKSTLSCWQAWFCNFEWFSTLTWGRGQTQSTGKSEGCKTNLQVIEGTKTILKFELLWPSRSILRLWLKIDIGCCSAVLKPQALRNSLPL